MSFGSRGVGYGCNAQCDPENDRECQGTQTESKDFFVFVFEVTPPPPPPPPPHGATLAAIALARAKACCGCAQAVSGENAYYKDIDGKDPYETGAGDAFSVRRPPAAPPHARHYSRKWLLGNHFP